MEGPLEASPIHQLGKVLQRGHDSEVMEGTWRGGTSPGASIVVLQRGHDSEVMEGPRAKLHSMKAPG